MWTNRNKQVLDDIEEKMNKCEAEKLQHEITSEYNKNASNKWCSIDSCLKNHQKTCIKKLFKRKNIGHKQSKQGTSVMKCVYQITILLQKKSIKYTKLLDLTDQ